MPGVEVLFNGAQQQQKAFLRQYIYCTYSYFYCWIQLCKSKQINKTKNIITYLHVCSKVHTSIVIFFIEFSGVNIFQRNTHWPQFHLTKLSFHICHVVHLKPEYFQETLSHLQKRPALLGEQNVSRHVLIEGANIKCHCLAAFNPPRSSFLVYLNVMSTLRDLICFQTVLSK